METPYTIRQAALTQAAARTISPLNLGSQGRAAVFDIAMPEGSYGDVELGVDAQNFLATITVTGSQVQGAAQGTALGAFTIFDLSRQKLGRSTVLHLPPSDFRYLHFRMTGPVGPDKITGLSILRAPVKEPNYRTVVRSAQFRQENRQTVVDFTVAANVPVDRVLFTPGSEAGFNRQVNVSVQPVNSPRETEDVTFPLAETFSASLIRLHTIENGQKVDEEQLAVDTPSMNSVPTNWTVTVENGDDAPLPLSSIQLDMRERSLCFQGDGRSRYTLLYGDPSLQAPSYDYAALHEAAANPKIAVAGQEQPNTDYQPRPDGRPVTDRHPALLWSALVGVILLLGAIAFKSNRQVSDASG